MPPITDQRNGLNASIRSSEFEARYPLLAISGHLRSSVARASGAHPGLFDQESALLHRFQYVGDVAGD